jgi:hypothetical protein
MACRSVGRRDLAATEAPIRTAKSLERQSKDGGQARLSKAFWPGCWGWLARHGGRKVIVDRVWLPGACRGQSLGRTKTVFRFACRTPQ